MTATAALKPYTDRRTSEFSAGWNARHQGRTIFANPWNKHKGCARERAAWDRGWNAANEGRA